MAKYDFSLDPVQVLKIQTNHRYINSSIPAPGTKEIIESLEKTESRSMQGQLPLIWNKAQDFSIFDISGNKFIDFTSTIFVANVGHGNKRVIEYVKKVLDTPLLSTYAYMSEIRATYLEKLITFAGKPFEKAFLLSAGTEATEAVLKLIRMHGSKIGKRKPGVITIQGNWHGRTMGAQMMSTNPLQKEWIGYQDPNIIHIDFPYPWQITENEGAEFFDNQIIKLKKDGINFDRDISGFMLETFQGWGAVFYPISFVKALKEFCLKHNILLAFDEMQAGFARTGKKFGFEHYQVEPDLIACGKGMGGGFPLSGVLGRKEIMDLPEVGNMSSTHSANPIVCAAGLAVLDEIEDRNLVVETERKGLILDDQLAKLKIKYPHLIDNYLGKGLIYSLIFKDFKSKDKSKFASEVCEISMRKGLLVVHTGRESIKLGPPLIISDEAICEAISVLDESIQEAQINV